MRIVIFDEALQSIGQLSKETPADNPSSGDVYGRVLDDGNVTQVLGFSAQGQPINDIDVINKPFRNTQWSIIGSWVLCRPDNGNQRKNLIADFLGEQADHEILIIVKMVDGGFALETFARTEPNSVPRTVEHIVYSLADEVFSRVKQLVSLDILKQKTVLVVGLGSGGGRVAPELAKAGVGRFILVDPDRLEPNNISRHPCGAPDIGRFKTDAIRNLINQHNPFAEVSKFEIDVLEQREQFRTLIQDCDVVLACTGSPAVNNLTNEYCIEFAKPAVYAAAWEKAMAGFSMRVIPNETPCFACVHGILLQNAASLDSSTAVDYTLVNDPRELQAEPGLSMDIGIITLIQAKLALLVLLDGRDTSVEDIEQDYILWFNRSYDRFKPFNCLKLHTKRRSDCVVCNYEGWLKKKAEELGTTVTELRDTKLDDLLE